jgi:thiamine phosphate synthase YjbQ (UPF0047 family)
MVVPIRDGQLALSTWQNVFLCDFDGPRAERRILVTISGEARRVASKEGA